ncbi:hypothetical protein QJS04_geneDACA007819 [Acorus gramineus]|uniref:Uncharacterized protein n=1 Tax=Acorus gramineus TaxID=55184 RepID=A0AAV9BC83_ACOGR|nr:hypothetical protein QJS04_geneDACA007819 [Acorus gramineus]
MSLPSPNNTSNQKIQKHFTSLPSRIGLPLCLPGAAANAAPQQPRRSRQLPPSLT